VAEVASDSSSELIGQDLNGKIVAICSADPGWDWLFSRNIAALITCYGGLNSHMAIRTNELGIPAVIGCGPDKYKSYTKATRLRINCESRTVQAI
jgi:phosphohistidine swiveling domain-containing protein